MPPLPHSGIGTEDFWLELASVCAGLLGIPVAWLMTVGASGPVRNLLASPAVNMVRRFWFSGWGFDWLYERVFVWPFVFLARVNRNDFIDLFYQALAGITEILNAAFRTTQSGSLRWYTLGLTLGAILILALVIFL